MITAARISPSGTKKPQRLEARLLQSGPSEAISSFKDYLLSINETEALCKHKIDTKIFIRSGSNLGESLDQTRASRAF
jgi:hypothetical protein